MNTNLNMAILEYGRQTLARELRNESLASIWRCASCPEQYHRIVGNWDTWNDFSESMMDYLDFDVPESLASDFNIVMTELRRIFNPMDVAIEYDLFERISKELGHALTRTRNNLKALVEIEF